MTVWLNICSMRDVNVLNNYSVTVKEHLSYCKREMAYMTP